MPLDSAAGCLLLSVLFIAWLTVGVCVCARVCVNGRDAQSDVASICRERQRRQPLGLSLAADVCGIFGNVSKWVRATTMQCLPLQRRHEVEVGRFRQRWHGDVV